MVDYWVCNHFDNGVGVLITALQFWGVRDTSFALVVRY